MKKLLFYAALHISALSFSQVGIGITTLNDSAQLDVTSTSKGLLPPRLTNAQKTAIATPVAGLLIWCIDCGTNGEMQVFNGTTWTNISGMTVPGAPSISQVIAGYKEATVTFTAPNNGGSTITGYTVTSSPGNITATGTSTSITVTGLTNGISYTFTVVATNAVGNSALSAAYNAVTPNCGAKISATVYKTFACYNLCATDTTVDPNIPIKAIHGNYYQWGISGYVATADTSSAAIPGWNTTPAANGAWLDASNDPCPAGFRVPTIAQWQGVIANNTISFTGPWTDSSTNFGAAIHFEPSTTIKTLTLPAAGSRGSNVGTLGYRGGTGNYWCSTEKLVPMRGTWTSVAAAPTPATTLVRSAFPFVVSQNNSVMKSI